MAYGSRDPKGCNSKKGICTQYHQVLCSYSVRDKLCINEKCTFVHLKGTRRKKPEDLPSDQGKSVNTTSVSGDSKNSDTSRDPLLRLESMILEIRSAQSAELTAIREELGYLKNQSIKPQARWEAPIQWPPSPQYNRMAYNPYMHYPPPTMLPQSMYSQNANQSTQQMIVPPEKNRVPSSCY